MEDLLSRLTPWGENDAGKLERFPGGTGTGVLGVYWEWEEEELKE